MGAIEHDRLQPLWAVILFGAVLPLCTCVRGGFDPREGSAEDGQAGRDASDSGVVLGPFGAPQQVAAFADPGADCDDPSLTGDQLEIYFNKEIGEDRRIYRSKRPSVSDPWEAPGAITELNTGLESNPAVSADGLSLYFSRDTGKWEIMVASRVARDAAWSAPSLLPQLNSSGKDLAGCVDASDLIFLYSSDRSGSINAHDLFVSTRATPTDPWGDPAPLVELNTASDDASPWSNAGATVLYFVSDRPGGAGDRDIYRARRASTADAFDPPTAVLELNSAEEDDDPWLSPDGRTIYFSSRRSGVKQIYRASR